jgi:hypothetical protein
MGPLSLLRNLLCNLLSRPYQYRLREIKLPISFYPQGCSDTFQADINLLTPINYSFFTRKSVSKINLVNYRTLKS